ncbi:MAG: hypothetical protein Q8M79_03915 [Dehalococcoidia bacterium]|nr:hypothetical protein [Dehalococcoidia bacterium]
MLITLDKDFGDLVFKERRSGDAGVILIRARASGPESLGAILLAALAMPEPWHDVFAVVEHDRVRITPLPPR